MTGVGFVMKMAVGQWATEPLVKEEKQEGDLDALGREMVAVAGAIPLKQAVTFQLAEIVTELVQAVSVCREAKAGKSGLVNLFGGPAADLSSAMEQHFQQANDPMIRVSWILIPG